MHAHTTNPPSTVEAWAQRLAVGPHVAGAVYGTIIAMTVMGAWLAAPTSGTRETLVSVAATLVVFWIAHVYAHVVGQGLGGSGGVTQELKHALQYDWPIVQVGLLPALVLAVGGLEWVDERLAMEAAVATSGAVLLAISLAVSRSGPLLGHLYVVGPAAGGLGRVGGGVGSDIGLSHSAMVKAQHPIQFPAPFHQQPGAHKAGA